MTIEDLFENNQFFVSRSLKLFLKTDSTTKFKLTSKKNNTLTDLSAVYLSLLHKIQLQHDCTSCNYLWFFINCLSCLVQTNKVEIL